MLKNVYFNVNKTRSDLEDDQLDFESVILA